MAVKQKGGVGRAILGTAGKALLHEAQNYAEARGEQLIRGLGDKVVGMLDGNGSSPLAGALGGGGDGDGGEPGGAGGAIKGALTGGLPGAVSGLLGRGGKGGKSKGARKSTNIIEDIDVPVPVSVAYNQWTQFQEFGGFMKGVQGVDKNDKEPTKSSWRVKVGPSRRSWTATTSEQIPDRRIVWASQGSKGSTKGVITFHPLADDLTKIIVVMEYTAVGPFEKVGNMMRLQLRRVRLDLREYKKFIAMRAEETDSWRGEIRDGEVVSEDDQGEQGGEGAEGAEEEAPEQEDQQPSDGEEEHPAAESEEEEDESQGQELPAAESEEEEEDEEQDDRSAPREREPATAGGRRRNS